jgi:fructokinase
VARRWLDLGPALVVVTRGAAGCVGFTAAGVVELPAVPVEVVDTVGAGDAFTGGLLAALHHRGWLARAALDGLTATETAEVLSYANHTSALTCRRAGAEPPYRREVEACGETGP